MNTRFFSALFASLVAAACSSVADDTSSGPRNDAGAAPEASAPAGDGGNDERSGNEQPANEHATAPLAISNLRDKTWTWFDIPGAMCRDGSPAGFGLSLNSASKKLMIFLQGGGACFNAQTCAGNPSTVGGKSGSAGIFARDRPENPVTDWNHVFVPYCTGDVHAGNNPNGNIPDVGAQKFVGYANMRLFLAKLAATFPLLEQILLTGSSAGGFGAAANYGQVVRLFPKVRVNLVDDSGPLMAEPPLARCLQEQWRALWKLDATVIADCGEDCANQPDFLMAATKHWAATKSTYAQGMVSSTADGTIRNFFGFGAANCTSFSVVPAEAFAAGLGDIRTKTASYSNFGTYVYANGSHTVLRENEFYSTALGSKSVAAWVDALVNANVVTNIGP